MKNKISIVLRLSAMASKFILLFLLAKFLPVDQIGNYGLLTAFLGYFVLAVGFDFYTYTTREIIGTDGAARSTALASHFTFFIFTYLAVVPIAISVAALGMLPTGLLFWFLLLLPLEHLGLELDRILIAMLRQNWAAVCIFIRQGLPTLITIPLMATIPSTRSLETTLTIWAAVDLVAVVLGFSFLVKTRTLNSGSRPSLKWIRRGLRVAIPFLMGTLLLRSIFTFDRQFMLVSGGQELLGVYSLYMGIAAGITQLIYVAIHQFRYPALISHAKRADSAGFRSTYRKMRFDTLALSFISLTLISLAAPRISDFYPDPIYSDYWWLLPATSGAIVLYNFSLVPHYALYAAGADRAIFAVTAVAVVVFFAFNLTLQDLLGASTTVSSIAAASLVLLLGKSAVLHRSPKVQVLRKDSK